MKLKPGDMARLSKNQLTKEKIHTTDYYMFNPIMGPEFSGIVRIKNLLIVNDKIHIIIEF